jgi:TRAP-type C4-dicarboxylate transport system substrate-binding protein
MPHRPSPNLVRRFAACLGVAALALVAFQSAPSRAQAGPNELNIGSLAPKGTPWADLLEKFEKQVEAATGGKLNVIIRPPGIMGEVEMAREARTGERLQGAAITTAALGEGGNIPVLQIMELPYLFKDSAQADKVLDNVLWKPVGDLLGKRGYVLAMWSENGWRNFATKGKAIKVPADLKSVKMRAQESDVHMAMYKQYGSDAVQKPMTEVLTSLNAGVIDGLDNTALYIMAGGLAEPLDHFTVSRHIYQPAVVVFSKTWFDQLDTPTREALLAAKSLTQESRDSIRSEDAAMIAALSEMGVEVHQLSDAEREAFAAEARKMHDPFAASLPGGANLLALIKAGL